MRALTSTERDIIGAMLEDPATAETDADISEADRERWLSQLSRTFAGNPCGCGTCPSIELTDAEGRTPDSWQTRIVLEATASEGLLLLFIDDDQLSYLELAPWADTPVLAFPPVSDTSLRG